MGLFKNVRMHTLDQEPKLLSYSSGIIKPKVKRKKRMQRGSINKFTLIEQKKLEDIYSKLDKPKEVLLIEAKKLEDIYSKLNTTDKRQQYLSMVKIANRTCQVCGKRFITKHGLLAHKLRRHQKKAATHRAKAATHRPLSVKKGVPTKTRSRSFFKEIVTKQPVPEDDKVWFRVMKEIFNKVPRDELVNNDGALIGDKLIEKIHTYMEDIIEFANKIQSTAVYREIKGEKTRLENFGYSEDEARAAAWGNLKYLIEKEVIHPFLTQMKTGVQAVSNIEATMSSDRPQDTEDTWINRIINQP